MKKYDLIKISSNDIMENLHDKFKDRSQKYQTDIDKIINRLNVLQNTELCKFIISNTTIECYLMKVSEDPSIIMEDGQFLEVEILYFLYKLAIATTEEVYFYINLYVGIENFNFLKHRNYFVSLINFQQNFSESFTETIQKFDQIADEIHLKTKLNLHKNAQSVSANLLGVKKNKSYRTQNEDDEITFNIKPMTDGYVKEIKCPVCEKIKSILYSNKKQYFIIRNDTLHFNCPHIGSKFFDQMPVKIDIKKYKKHLKYVDAVDWAIYNHKHLFREFLLNQKNIESIHE